MALAILAVLLARIEPGKVLDQLRLAPWWAMVLPSVLMFGNTVLHSARLWLLLREVPWPRVLRISLLGNFFGILLPSGGGEAVKVLALGRSTPGLGYEQAAAALLATRVLDLVPWAAFLVWAAVGVLPERLPAFAGLAAAGAGALTCGILVSVAALHWGPAGLQRLPVRVARWFAPLARLRANAAPLWVSLVLAFPFAFVNIAVVWAIGRAYGIPLPLPEDRLPLFDPAFDVQLRDVDRDGRADLVLTTSAQRNDEIETRIDLYRQRTEGGPWGDRVDSRLRLQTLAGPPQVVDADGDGSLDLVALTVRTDLLRGLQGGAAALDVQLNVYRGDNGRFALPAMITQKLQVTAQEGKRGGTGGFARVLAGVDGAPGSVLLHDGKTLQLRPFARDGRKLTLGDATWKAPIGEKSTPLPPAEGARELLIANERELLFVRWQ